MDQNWWHKPGQSLGWWLASSQHPFSTLDGGKQLWRKAACVSMHGAGLVLALARLLKAKTQQCFPRSSWGPRGGVAPTPQRCGEMSPSVGCRQGCYHLSCALGSRPLCSWLPCQRALERASQVTLNTHCPPCRSRLGLRDHADLVFTPAPIKGPRCLGTGSVQTEQTGSAQRDSVAVLHPRARWVLCSSQGCLRLPAPQQGM